jgi:hypothetical protein
VSSINLYLPIYLSCIYDIDVTVLQTRAPWQASNESIQAVIGMKNYRRVPTNEEHANLSNPFKFIKTVPGFTLDGSAAWIHMIGPIGVYYIYALDVHPAYQTAFANILWWMLKLRRRFATKDSVDAQTRSYSFVKWGRDVLARLEYLMPSHFCTFVFHLLQHACHTIFMTGPPHGTWAFVFERWVQIAKKLLHSSNNPMKAVVRAVMRQEWLTYFHKTSQADLDELLTPPSSHCATALLRPLGKAKRTQLNVRWRIDGISKLAKKQKAVFSNKTDWRHVYDFLLSEDPFYSTLCAFYERATNKRDKLLDEWDPSPAQRLALIQELSEKFNILLTSSELTQVLKGPPLAAKEYKRMEINGVTFVTHAYQRLNGQRDREHIFYVNQHQMDEFNNGRVSKDQIKYPVGRIDRILSISSSAVLRVAKHYYVLRIRNFQYLANHVSQLPHVAATGETQPFINAATVRPYNIALWPANARVVTERLLAVWIDPQHGDTL